MQLLFGKVHAIVVDLIKILFNQLIYKQYYDISFSNSCVGCFKDYTLQFS